MESKGRRASRAAGPAEAPAELDKAVEISVAAAEPTAISDEPRNPAETAVEPPEPTEASGQVSAATLGPLLSPGASAEAKGPASKEAADFGREVLAALTQSQAALARGLDALSAEMAGLALSGMDTAARAASKMLGIRTLCDAIEVNAGFTCSSLDAVVGRSARFSEIGAKLAAETSQPLLSQFGRGWIKSARRSS